MTKLDEAAEKAGPEAVAELAELRLGHQRYETIRRMNVGMLKDAWELNIRTNKPFDEIIDGLRPFLFASSTPRK